MQVREKTMAFCVRLKYGHRPDPQNASIMQILSGAGPVSGQAVRFFCKKKENRPSLLWMEKLRPAFAGLIPIRTSRLSCSMNA